MFVIVLHYTGKQDTEECLHSVLASTPLSYKLILVNNGSSDTFDIPNVTVVNTGANLGYAGGNNVGMRYALDHGATSVLLLNNDVILHPDCLRHFADAAEQFPGRPLGGKVYDYDPPRSYQEFCGRWNPWRGKFTHFPSPTFNPDTPQTVDFIKGCALFIPCSLLRKIGLFDERFFLYYEEIDFCFRAAKAGFPPLYTPLPILWHKESKSFSDPKPAQAYYQSRNKLLFIERNLSFLFFTLLTIALLACKALLGNSIASIRLRGIRDYLFRTFGPQKKST